MCGNTIDSKLRNDREMRFPPAELPEKGVCPADQHLQLELPSL